MQRIHISLRRVLIVVVAAVMTLALGACGGGGERQRSAAPSTGNAAATVVVADSKFTPSDVEISAGETVDWRWEGATVHDVAFDEGGPASPIQRTGTWAHAFDRPGTYGYVCTLHAGMVGEVVVR